LWPTVSPSTEILNDIAWQMTFGERAALEGVLAQVKPEISIEIGTAEGGSLQRVALHSKQVHSFDLVEPAPEISALKNVTLHTGDSHVLLKKLLAELSDEGTNVDFVLVDGDHSADGAEEDLRDLLASPAIGRTVILMHDTLNDEVREGFSRIDYADVPKVVHSDLDFLVGHLSRGGDFHHQLWGGMGLVIVDTDGEKIAGIGGDAFFDPFEVFSAIRDAQGSGPGEAPAPASDPAAVSSMQREIQRAHDEIKAIKRSPSWRVTAPLRAAKRAVSNR
jgi:Methyltransferase domain